MKHRNDIFKIGLHNEEGHLGVLFHYANRFRSLMSKEVFHNNFIS